MASETRTPTAFANDNTAGTVAWTDPSNAASSDDSYAFGDNIPAGSGSTQYLVVTDCGFSLPNSTIDGVLLEVEGKGQSAGLIIFQAFLVLDGVVGAGNQGQSDFAGSSDAWMPIPLDSPTDELWGQSPTYTKVNQSDFGFAIQAVNTDPFVPIDAWIDNVRITVYYTETGGGLSIPITMYHYRQMANL